MTAHEACFLEDLTLEVAESTKHETEEMTRAKAR